MRNLRLTDMQTFITVVNKSSFKESAKELRASQGTISIRISNIEKYFEVPLLIRSKKKIKITPEGQAVYDCFQEILNRLQHTTSKVLGNRQQVSGAIKLSASTLIRIYILPKSLEAFKAKYPKVSFDIEISDVYQSIEKLNNRNVDLVFIGTIKGINTTKYEIIKFFEDEILISVPPNHELAKKDFIDAKELVKYPLITRPKSFAITIEFMEILKKYKIPYKSLKIIMVLDSTDSVISAVSAGFGIAPTSSIPAKKAEERGLIKTLKIKKTNTKRSFFILANKDSSRSKLINTFMQFLKQTSPASK